MKECCEKVSGIAVDTHIHKIANRLEWVNKTKDPDKTSFELEKIVDKKYWGNINSILVGFGQEICKSVKPDCEISCTLCSDCSYYKNVVSKKKNKSDKKEKPKSKTEFNSKSKSRSNSKGKKNKVKSKKIRKKKVEYESDNEEEV